MSEKIRILFLAANPTDTARILVNKERDRILRFLYKSNLEDSFKVRSFDEFRATELQEEIRSFKPNIIHFGGHGEEDGLIFTDDEGKKSHLITKDTLAGFFERCKPYLKAVILNACYSAKQADSIKEKVPFFIGMNAAIDDEAALAFSEGFYTYLFNNHDIFNKPDLDIKNAYEDAKYKMRSVPFSEEEIGKFVLEQPPFIPHCKQDILICFSKADEEWTNVLKQSLKDDLENTLCPNGNLEVQSRSDLKDIQSSAIILLIMSEAFLNEQRENLHSLELVSNRGTHIYVILLETYKHSIPIELKGLEERIFFELSGNVVSRLRNNNYKKELKGLVAELEAKLEKLKPTPKVIPTPLPDTTLPNPEPLPEVKEAKNTGTPTVTQPELPTQVKVEVVKTTPPKIEEKVPPSNGGNTGTQKDKSFDYKKYGIIGGLVLAGLGSWKFLDRKPPEPPSAPVSVAPAPAPAPQASPAPVSIAPPPTPTAEIIDNRYQILANGAEVKDLQTNLIWQRCQVGMNWNGNTCTGEASKFTFDDAQKQAGNGWRVPTIRELSSLIVCSSGKMKDSDDVGDGGAPIKNWCDGDYTKPMINTKAFPNTPASVVWSGSPSAGSTSLAWYVLFNDGNSSYSYRYNLVGVRLVRGGQ